MFRLVDSDNCNLNDNLKNNNRFEVFGKGSINVKPDVAEIIVGVITQNPQLQIAQQENSNITKQVVNSIISSGVLRKYIQTQSYNIKSNYDYIDGKQVFRNYEVNNELKIIITDIDFIGEIVDIAIENGANNISGISFGVSNQNTYYYEALKLAITDAQNKALAMASKLKLKLDTTPVQINEKDRGRITSLAAVNIKNISSDTGIEIGQSEISAEIEAIFKYYN